MRVAYIVGAGASAALQTDDQRVPTMAILLEEMSRLFPERWKEIEWALNQLAIIWEDGVFLMSYGPRAGQPLDFELLMQTLEELCSSSAPDNAQKMEIVYNQLVDIACRLFARFDEDLVSKLPKEKNVYRSLAKAISCNRRAEHTFISFNYDVWLEQALGDECDWDPTSGYWFNEAGYKAPNWCETNVYPGGDNSLQVYKPHGSVSWFVPQSHPFADPLVILQSGKVERHILVEPRVGYLPSDREYVLVDPGAQLQKGTWRPLVMPPTQHKGISGRAMARMYQNMDRALREADAVVVIGWSMPLTDLFMRLRIYDIMASRGRGVPKELVVCDVNPTDVFYNRYSAIFPAEDIKRYTGGFDERFLEEFLVPLWRMNV